jgi:hypothetical protein
LVAAKITARQIQSRTFNSHQRVVIASSEPKGQSPRL